MRAHEEKAARERREIGRRMEAGAKALRRWGSSLQHAEQVREAYATCAIAAVVDTLAMRPARFPSTAINDALRAAVIGSNPFRAITPIVAPPAPWTSRE